MSSQKSPKNTSSGAAGNTQAKASSWSQNVSWLPEGLGDGMWMSSVVVPPSRAFSCLWWQRPLLTTHTHTKQQQQRLRTRRSRALACGEQEASHSSGGRVLPGLPSGSSGWIPETARKSTYSGVAPLPLCHSMKGHEEGHICSESTMLCCSHHVPSCPFQMQQKELSLQRPQ